MTLSALKSFTKTEGYSGLETGTINIEYVDPYLLVISQLIASTAASLYAHAQLTQRGFGYLTLMLSDNSE